MAARASSVALVLCASLFPAEGFNPKLISVLNGSSQLFAGHQSSWTTSASQLEKSNGLLYRKSVFNADELCAIEKDVVRLEKHLVSETSSSVAQFRVGTTIPPSDEAYRIFQEGTLAGLIQKVVGPDYELAKEIPLEIRRYSKPGASMAWHVDDVLYDPPQVEIVWTLDNTSDCSTLYETTSKKGNNNNKNTKDNNIEMVETERNSVLILQAGGPSHCVTSLKRGSRTILKCAFAHKDAVVCESQQQQFAATTSSSKRRKRNALPQRKR